jgi:7,8-dihydropterin-6-yl-methyl-4-(beta-D-ribofuranosyl)aminobenzene 5'-phosphate synthase
VISFSLVSRLLGGAVSLHKCRLCGADLNRSFVDLGMSPLCESYIPAARLDDPETFYPLHVLICESCLAGLAGRRGTRSLPMVVHPLVWTRRRLALPGGGADDWPTLSKHALTGEGFDVIERRQPSLLVDGSILITGEVDRTTDFEHGMPPAHQHWTGTTWEPDPLILDDQALVVNVRGQGLVIVTGCGHAGAVNIVRHAQRLTGVPRLHALLGGLHLGGAFFTPSIGPTVHALTELAPDLLVPGHCTGWRAQHALAAALPDSWVQGSSGTRYHLTAS